MEISLDNPAVKFILPVEIKVPSHIVLDCKAAFWAAPYEDGRGNKIEAIKFFRTAMNDGKTSNDPLYCGLGVSKEVVEWMIEKGLFD